MRCRARERHVILHQHAIVDHAHARRMRESSRCIEARPVKDDVVALPLARRSTRIHQRRVLAVDRRRLAIRVGRVVVRVEHLQLV